MIWSYSLETYSVFNIKSLILPYPNFQKLPLNWQVPDTRLDCKAGHFCGICNTTFGYCLGKQSSNKFLAYERHLGKKLFEKIDFGIKSEMPITILIWKLSPFRKLFDEMIISIIGTGFYKKMDEYKVDVLVNHIGNKPEDLGISFSKLIFPMQMYAFAIVLSTSPIPGLNTLIDIEDRHNKRNNGRS
uniref:Uncharacterized protein n=1 Tax=Megaselia scalaris TaxID=36166 RepID=T1H0K3_MEGSC